MKTLTSMIARTSFAISMEESRFTLNGALLLMRPEGLTMVATDGHRLAFVQATPAESGTADKQFRALVPKKAMTELVKLADDAGPDGKAIVCRRRQSPVLPGRPSPADHAQADRQFPGLRARAAQGSPVRPPRSERDEIRSAIERVAQFADERSRAIRVQFTNGEVRVFSSSVETGESEESVPSEYHGSRSRDRFQRAIPARFPARDSSRIRSRSS